MSSLVGKKLATKCKVVSTKTKAWTLGDPGCLSLNPAQSLTRLESLCNCPNCFTFLFPPVSNCDTYKCPLPRIVRKIKYVNTCKVLETGPDIL